MRGLVPLSSLKYKFKQLYPVAGSWGTVSTSTPKKHNTNDSTEGDEILNGSKAEPIVAFSRPPPPPPVFGPLVAVYLLEMWLSRDNDDD